ncbi:hypothetical protein SmJEL517_g03875 [Synchytrium microbalum]|uniref:Shikimate O-hydroxycinnamoyltransferase n=1 Tax=Synchytrium microbalum TaxID=1806994 RepID=A0A507C6L9_9FUNG|nr:uncharacterized protein SmJEL517_g03875 [Synchytrium microbalum]TPX33193.1 hypothetical protein SmJEL517_g03875 [Synchytrium microbalum]
MATVRETHLVKALPTPQVAPKPSYDLNVLDSTLAKFLIRPAYFFEAPKTPLSTDFWISSLSKTLSEYRFLTGTVIRHSPTRLVLCENERGCHVEFADLPNLTLKELRDKRFSPSVVPDVLYPTASLATADETWTSIELLRIRITVLGDGGIVLSPSMFHSFIKDWAAVARGETIKPVTRDASILKATAATTSKPVEAPVEANRFKPASAPVAAPAAAAPALPAPPATPQVLENFYVSPASMKSLKAYVCSLPLPDGPMQKAANQVSTSDCLSALVWWSVVQASNARARKSKTIFAYPVNMRTLQKPLVPMDYVGNAWLSMHERTAKFQIDDLVGREDGIRMGACAIRQGICELTEDYLRGFLEKNTVPIPDMSILGCFFTSWRGFGVYDTDFGFGKPVEFIPQHSKNPYVIVGYIRPMAPEHGGEAGAEFQLCLAPEEVERLKNNPVFSRFAHWYHEDGTIGGRCNL